MSVALSKDPDLKEVARRVNWYTPPEDLLEQPSRFLREVMARGHTQDVIIIQKRFDRETLKKAYLQSPPGLFDQRSWAYWGVILCHNNAIPMPERFPDADSSGKGTLLT